MGRSATGGDRVRAALNAEQAVNLRIAGASFRAIAFQLKISPAQAQRYVARHLEATRARTAEQVEHLRQIECERMEHVILSLWPKRDVPKNAVAIIAASKRRSELLGLDAPLRLEDVTPQAPTGETLDLSRLSVDDLRAYEAIILKARRPLLASETVVPAEISEIPCGDEPPADEEEVPVIDPDAVAPPGETVQDGQVNGTGKPPEDGGDA